MEMAAAGPASSGRLRALPSKDPARVLAQVLSRRVGLWAPDRRLRGLRPPLAVGNPPGWDRPTGGGRSMEYLVALILVIVVAVLVGRRLLRRVVLLEYERGVHYQRGAFRRVLGPGIHWYLASESIVHRLDLR